MTHLALVTSLLLSTVAASSPWLKGHAYKLPTEYTNQESGYFSIIDGKNGRLYIGAAKYGVNAYLIEFDPATGQSKMVVDAHKVIGSNATGFAAQAKFHTRNNVGASGKIYVATKQGYPEKGESRDLYPGGYVITYDPATGQSEHFGIAKPKHGIISVAPDEEKGLAYISTCSDDRPIDHTHFMVLDLKAKTYRDLGDMEAPYAFVVVDHRHRAWHPKRGGQVARFDPERGQMELLDVTVDGKPVPAGLSKDDSIQNWEVTRDRRTLYCVEMTTNQLFAFDLTAEGKTLPGRSLGPLLANAKSTDCRAMTVGPDGRVWAAVSTNDGEGQVVHLVMYRPGDKAPLDLGPIAIANPDYTTFTDAAGKPKPWHHTVRKAKDGTLVPWQPMGVCPTPDGCVYVKTIAPYTLLKFTPEQLKQREQDVR